MDLYVWTLEVLQGSNVLEYRKRLAKIGNIQPIVTRLTVPLLIRLLIVRAIIVQAHIAPCAFLARFDRCFNKHCLIPIHVIPPYATKDEDPSRKVNRARHCAGRGLYWMQHQKQRMLSWSICMGSQTNSLI